MLKNTLLITVITIMLSEFASSYDKKIDIGAGFGLTRGINEGVPSDRTIGPLIGIFGVYHNGFLNRLSPELSVNYYQNSTTNVNGGFSEYNTSHITPEIRLRYTFTENTSFTPYILGGIGLMFYSMDEQKMPENKSPDAKASGMTPSIPFALGFTYNIDDNWGLDFNAGINFSLTDDLNPVYDDKKDASWVARIGATYKIAEYLQDTDSDGLPDDVELKIGTELNNPDTDGDGLLDGAEYYMHKTNPINADTDGGGINDGVEVQNLANPLDSDDDIMNIQVGQKIILKNIEFPSGKSDITDKSEKILRNVLIALQKFPKMCFEIVGHTDDIGARDNNVRLSRERAEAVKMWLQLKGIQESRLTARGAGPEEPLVPNINDVNRQRNRRVEFYRTK